ncbi:MAG: SLBB domain-containing protein [candidate division Zixibacteria bacterium]|nr:SLBB domain-containing protein [candidate division Zixibacteria bacterium]
MRKFLIVVLAIIILVCLNWFTDAVAQDLKIDGLSAEQKKALLQRYDATGAEEDTGAYRTPEIFSNDGLARRPETPDDTPTSTPVDGSPALTPFSELEPFGTGLFADARDVVPPNDVAADDDYVLGPGDNILVNLWGRVEQEYALVVNREGKITIPRAGEILAWGKTLGEFEPLLKQRLSSVYSGFELSVSLGKIRSIRLYLTGEVKRPGAYTVSSLTSLFNALYLAGGPGPNGSMRSIRVMRNGKQVAEADLYRFLLEGDNSSDVRLQSGDAIFVPVAGPRVAIRGRINRPAIYELKHNETALDVLALAGNARPEAYLDRVMLERVSGRDQWAVIDLNLNDAVPDSTDRMPMLDGDRMTVFSVFELKHNMVAAFGLVQHPGYYERNDSTTISELLSRSKLQPYDVYYGRANLFRHYSDWRTEVVAIDLQAALDGDAANNLVLRDRDSLHVYSISDVTWDKYVYISGEVRRPGRFRLYDNMTIEDLVFLAGSFTRGALVYQAEIARIDSSGNVLLSQINLGDPYGSRLRLEPDDRLYIRRLPHWQLHKTVWIEGEVLYPGEYVIQEGRETLYDLLTRAGGFTNDAFPQGTVFERQSIGEQLERMKIPTIMEKSSPIIKDSLGRLTREALFEYDARQVNRVVIDMDRLLATSGKHADIFLESGDRILVPTIPTGITVLGSVGSNGTIKYRENEKVKYYVQRAGNFTSQADKKGTRLIKANGEVFSGGDALGSHVDIGDVIVVPTKIKDKRDWGKTVTTVLTTTTGVLTTILLIDRL